MKNGQKNHSVNKRAQSFLVLTLVAEMAHAGIAAAATNTVELWTGGAFPKTSEIPVLKNVRFGVIKPYEFQRDGYRFLHGIALAWHKGKLYASFGHNKEGENTDAEEAHVRVSSDGGTTWGPVEIIDSGKPGIAVSHGVFLSHKGRLWAFHGTYEGILKNVRTLAYVLNEDNHSWVCKGVAVESGFWATQGPLRMPDGNWIMAGLRVGEGNPAAVAISHGEDFTKWDLVVIPPPAGLLPIWGESAVFVDGRRVVNVARCNAKNPLAFVAFSDDFGRTWTESSPSNLPMPDSKPYCGTLSTGQNFLICSTTADGGNRRSPLTIALSHPGEGTFSKVFVIRHALFPGGPGESNSNAALAYPYAVECEGKLYVGYSNSGGGVGRTGKGRECWNNNSAELAIIPIDELK